MQYQHTQRAPLYLILSAAGIAMLAGGLLTPQPLVQILLPIGGGLMLLVALMFKTLTVSDEGRQLLLRFGPVPLFRKAIPYAEIDTAVRGRTTIFDGWGIHISPGGGWTWNLWGFDCVDVTLKNGRRTRIGTDDPEGLAAFLTERMSEIP
ncbi:MAG: hypothetical protein ACE5KM_08655 [Planctomycetaceae bacterium]